MKTRAHYDCFVGTYTRTGGSRGIYLLRFHPDSRELKITGTTVFKENPSFLVLDHGVGRLFAVHETGGDRAGMVSMFTLDRHGDGYELDAIASAPSSGKGPCHLLYDAGRNRIVVANYASGSIGVIAVDDEAKRLDAVQGIQHVGSGIDPKRQEGPHAHSVTADPTRTRVIVCDLGLDEVIVYEWDRQKLLLIEEPVCRAKVPAGGGPRHFAFHPNGSFGYVANEMGNSVTAFTYDSKRGVLEATGTVGSLPAGFTGENTTADIHLDAEGRRLYLSNRGHDSVAVFAIDQGSGSLSPVRHIPTGGRTPRNFAITPDDHYLFAAHQDSGSITVFDIASNDLASEPIARIEIPMPVCVKFA